MKKSICLTLVFILLLSCISAGAVSPGFVARGECGSNAKWEIANSTLTISGTGETFNYTAYSHAPWYDYKSSSGWNDTNYIKRIVVEEGITKIGDYSFYESYHVESVSLPGTLLEIGECAFKYCRELNEIVIPDSVNMIGNGSFYGCKDMTKAFLSRNTEDISKECFYNCSSLKSIAIPDSVKNIYNSAFYGCKALTDISFGKKLETISDKSFYGCENLGRVLFPKSIKEIGTQAFYGCTVLNEVKLKNGIEKIGYNAFANCINLKEIVIPGSITEIYFSIFSGCKELKTIYIQTPENEEWISSIKEGNNAELVWNYIKPLYRGDINLDDKITSVDYTALKRYYSNQLELDEEALQCADINGDNKISSADYLVLKKYFKGMDTFGIGEQIKV